MSKLNPVIMASSALVLALQVGPAMSETAKKKAATAKNAVSTLQNGYTGSDTSARPQGVSPSDYAVIKVDAVGGSPSGGTSNPNLPPPPLPDEAANPDNPSSGTDNPVLPPPPTPTEAANPDDPSSGTSNPDAPPPPPPTEAANPDDPSSGTNNPDLPPPPPPISAG